ncbi:NAD-P-binding protein [Mycena metata]|uniref:NAD-P-binding protein n=1 Tax=Mycena metata TaxID=1033252 RepID=A0AAD7IK89_9AGAR|nr:NAD-P-binding protein [Mycena metata]
MSESSKLILVIGATGAQGQAVIEALLAPTETGEASPYTVRALTRDPTSRHAKALAARGVECVQGSFTDYASVAKALDGVYGAWVNTDGFTVGEMEEIYAGMRIYEVAKTIPSLRHYVWSNLQYVLKNAKFDPQYSADHLNAKGRVGEWLGVQPSVLDDGLTWSQVTTGPYMDMLKGDMFSPLNVRKDGTVVFAAPIEDGHVPMIALKDLGWWARWTFDHREEASGRDLNITSDRVHWDYLVKTFTKVTGKPAVFKRLTLDEWFANFEPEKLEAPVATEKERGDGSKTIRENSAAFWRLLRDDIIRKDLEWIRSVHPGTYTLERWMRENEYIGRSGTVLKNTEEGKRSYGFRPEVAALL